MTACFLLMQAHDICKQMHHTNLSGLRPETIGKVINIFFACRKTYVSELLAFCRR